MVDAPDLWNVPGNETSDDSDVPVTGLGSGEADQQARRMIPFLVSGPVTFAPTYFPETVRVRKEREIDRTRNFCKGEDATDAGAKNREIHVTGIMVGDDKKDFEDLEDLGEPVNLSSQTWSGEVLVKEGEVEGPTGWDAQLKEHHYRYTLDFVATGAERDERVASDGIISAPDNSEGDFINRGP